MVGVDDFEEVAAFALRADGTLPVAVARSRSTGLIVVVCSQPSPVAHAALALVTEAGDDAGLPHTLEHAVFMGSRLFPPRVLDVLANRSMADGSNAYTDTDTTVYTVETAGGEGMLRFLPVYLDHLLHPLLTDAAFKTEVHSINGEGRDVGVVCVEERYVRHRPADAVSSCFCIVVVSCVLVAVVHILLFLTYVLRFRPLPPSFLYLSLSLSLSFSLSLSLFLSLSPDSVILVSPPIHPGCAA